MWEKYNPNPIQRSVGDCTVRAIAKALNMGWEAAYIALVINGLQMADMPSSDAVSGSDYSGIWKNTYLHMRWQ